VLALSEHDSAKGVVRVEGWPSFKTLCLLWPWFKTLCFLWPWLASVAVIRKCL
jgi:hypothetical protein